MTENWPQINPVILEALVTEVNALRARLAALEALCDKGVSVPDIEAIRERWSVNLDVPGYSCPACGQGVCGCGQAQEDVQALLARLAACESATDQRTCGCKGKPFQVCDTCQNWGPADHIALFDGPTP